MSRAKSTRRRTTLHLEGPPIPPSRRQPPESGTSPRLRLPSRLRLVETREDLRDLPAWLLALVLALGLGAGVLVSWMEG